MLRRMIRTRSTWLILAAVLCWQLLSASTTAAQLPDGERELVQRLVDRAFFDLAEQYCRQRLEDRADVNVRSEWEFLLSECHQQHAWWMENDSRVELIRMAAHRITDFLKSNTPSPENDLMLRVRQIELLASAGMMESVLEANVTNTVWTLTENPRDNLGGLTPTARQGVGHFALEAVRQSSELSVALLAQLDELRKDIDRDVARSARERIRCALADMMFAQSRLMKEPEAADLRRQANEMAEQLLKSSNDDGLRFHARLLLADIQLDQRDFEAYRLRFTSLQSTADSDMKHTAAVALKIRGLLVQGQPSEALQECVNQTKSGALPTQELRALRLQGLLQLLELLSQLDPALPQTGELRTKTIDEFTLLKEKALATTRGVWRERCVRIANRFERVEQVGPEAATELEDVSALAEAGDIKTARETLLKLAGRTPRQSPAVTSMFLLQSGDFAVRMSDWPAAIDDLKRSRDLFHESGDIAREAAADLLRIFAIGRQWDSDNNDPSTEAAYRAALEAHVHDYAQQTTVVKAREWRARLLRLTDPLQAAEELLEIASTMDTPSTDSTSGPMSGDERLSVLTQAGDCLLDAAHRPEKKTTDVTGVPRFAVIVQRFEQQSPASAASPSESTLPLLNLLKAQRLCLAVRADEQAVTEWNSLQADSKLLLPVLTGLLETKPAAGTGGNTDENPPTVQNVHALIHRTLAACYELHVLSSLRELEAAASFEASRTSLEIQSSPGRLRTARWLVRHLSRGKFPLPGDPQLAQFLVRLLEQPTNVPADALTIEQQTEAVEILHRACAVAGQPEIFEQRLNELLAASLSDEQLSRIAAIVSVSAVSTGNAPDPGQSRRFWQSVHKRSKAGDDAWFEASLQIALQAQNAGDRKEAKRILGVVSVLHPDWGTPERRVRAEELQKQLESTP